MEIRCPNPDCKCIVVEDITMIKDLKYLLCPYCNAMFINKFYEKE